MIEVNVYHEGEYIDVDKDVDENIDAIFGEIDDSDLIEEVRERNLSIVKDVDRNSIVEFLQKQPLYELHDILCDVIGISYYHPKKKEIIEEYIQQLLYTRKNG